MKILFSACGRRVELMRSFREALRPFSHAAIIGTDVDWLAPGLREADRGYLVPKYNKDVFIQKMLEICIQENIDMLIPLIDPELSIYADTKGNILDNGTDVIISNPSVIDLCSSKVKTARFFSETGLPFLETLEIGEINGDQDIHFPAILKPCLGSGGKDVYLVENMHEVEALSNRIDNPIIQERAEGQEITLDCLADFSGSPVRIVARERLEIRSGESSKGRTFKDNNLLRLVFELLSNLHAIGPVTVQCFRSNGKYVFSEINPRFGGGYPLSHAAGANFPALLIQMYNRQQIKGQLDEYEENLYFCRYDDAFYFRKDEGQSKFPSPDGKD